MNPVHHGIHHIKFSGQSPGFEGEPLATASVFNKPITVSAAAISYASPIVPIERMRPSGASICVYRWEVYTLPSSPLNRCRLNSGRGAQYTSGNFQKWCAGNHVTLSMGLTRVCWDNYVAENFLSNLKIEMHHHYTFPVHLSAGVGRTAATRVCLRLGLWLNTRTWTHQ